MSQQQWIVYDELYVVTFGRGTLSKQGWALRKYTLSGGRRFVVNLEMVPQ